jgi:hypothetical protein
MLTSGENIGNSPEAIAISGERLQFTRAVGAPSIASPGEGNAAQRSGYGRLSGSLAIAEHWRSCVTLTECEYRRMRPSPFVPLKQVAGWATPEPFYCFSYTSTDGSPAAFCAVVVIVRVLPPPDNVNVLFAKATPSRLSVTSMVLSLASLPLLAMPEMTNPPVTGFAFPSNVNVELTPRRSVVLRPFVPRASIFI